MNFIDIIMIVKSHNIKSRKLKPNDLESIHKDKILMVR